MTYTLKYSLQAFCTEHLTPVSGIPLSNVWNTLITDTGIHPQQILEYPTTDTGISHRRYWLLVPFSTHYRLQITVSEFQFSVNDFQTDNK